MIVPSWHLTLIERPSYLTWGILVIPCTLFVWCHQAITSKGVRVSGWNLAFGWAQINIGRWMNLFLLWVYVLLILLHVVRTQSSLKVIQIIYRLVNVGCLTDLCHIDLRWWVHITHRLWVEFMKLLVRLVLRRHHWDHLLQSTVVHFRQEIIIKLLLLHLRYLLLNMLWYLLLNLRLLLHYLLLLNVDYCFILLQ